jgi:uncharacterized membrane protein YjjB (DUF3815 family)
MMIADIVSDGLLAAIAGIGFGAISRPPVRAFAFIALLSAIGHAMRYYMINELGVDIALSSFCASLVIGMLSLWLGKRIYCPITVLYIPALLPMIPGMYAYKTIFAAMMFMQHLGHAGRQAYYMQELFSNAVVTLSTVFLLSVGATSVIFIFPKMTYSLTRRNRPQGRV